MITELKTPLKQIVVVPYVRHNRWDGVHWITLTDIDFTIDYKSYTVKSGFVTDMGSIPRLARMTVDRMGNSLAGFIIHDWLYTEDAPVSRKIADRALYQIGRYCGESWYSANKIYYAVRAGGAFAKMSPNKFEEVSTETILKIIKDNKNETV